MWVLANNTITMARKRTYDATTDAKYFAKIYQLAYARSGHPELAYSLASAASHTRARGYGPFRLLWLRIIPVLQKHGVPSYLWGAYRSFAFEVFNKVLRRAQFPYDVIKMKWGKLDPAIMDEIAEVIGALQPPEPETPQPAQR